MQKYVVIAGVFLLAWPVTAQDEIEGRFAAAALGSIEPGAALQIELLDNSDLNLRLLGDFELLLAEFGYSVVDEGNYELTFVTEEITDAPSVDSTIFRFQFDTRSGVNPNTKQRGGAETRAKLWSSTQNSLFARRGTSGSERPLLRMEVEIRSLADKPRIVWAARVETRTRRGDLYGLFRQMVPVFAENIGEFVAENTIILR